MRFVRKSEQWQCDHCKNVRNTANTRVLRYQCDTCDFDLCVKCMLTTVTPLRQSAVVEDGSSSDEEDDDEDMDPSYEESGEDSVEEEPLKYHILTRSRAN